jgi:hypothetical protein
VFWFALPTVGMETYRLLTLMVWIGLVLEGDSAVWFGNGFQFSG